MFVQYAVYNNFLCFCKKMKLFWSLVFPCILDNSFMKVFYEKSFGSSLRYYSLDIHFLHFLRPIIFQCFYEETALDPHSSEKLFVFFTKRS